MNSADTTFGFFARLRLSWFRLLRSVLHLWVRAKILPQPFEDLELDRSKPICYVIDSYALTSLLILDRACEQYGLPRPLWPMPTAAGVEPRSYLALRRKKGLIIRRTEVRRHSDTLPVRYESRFLFFYRFVAELHEFVSWHLLRADFL